MGFLGDSWSDASHLPPFPYDEPLQALIPGINVNARPWSLRLDVDYTDNFNGLDSVGGHILFETASRFGVDAAACRVQERLPGGQFDRLCLPATPIWSFALRSRTGPNSHGLGANWQKRPNTILISASTSTMRPTSSLTNPSCFPRPSIAARSVTPGSSALTTVSISVSWGRGLHRLRVSRY